MFYGAPFIMAPPAKSRLKRQGQLLSSVLSRTLSYKSQEADSGPRADDPAELSTQLSAPGVLKVFGDSVAAGAHYKSVLATGASSARELVREALERYALSPERAGLYVLCDVVGRAGPGCWRPEGLRVFGDHEKPLLAQELWRPREGLARRFELRRRSDVEELAARDVDTTTAGINAQARRLQRSRAKGTPAPTPGAPHSPTLPRLRRTLSETSLSPAPASEEPAPEEPGQEATRCSRYQAPHLLLLQGYSPQHDSLVYVLSRECHTVGQRTAASSPSISLAAPDILPLHCTLRRRGGALLLEPLPGAPVALNFRALGARPRALRHGDLLALGLHYLLLVRDPAGPPPLPAPALARLRALPPSCRLCGAAPRAPTPAPAPAPAPPPRPRPPPLDFGPDEEDALLRRIVARAGPGGEDQALAPAFLLGLCVQHAAARPPPGAFGRLLLKIAEAVRQAVWEKTRELAEKQAQLQEPLSPGSVTVAGLAPDLRHLLFWMANAVELLFLAQQRCPCYLQSLEEQLDPSGSRESLLSCALTASEEAMAELEEVVLYAFQQCVYYLSKALYSCLPGLLEGSPFPAEPRPSWRPAPGLPEELRRVVAVYQAALDLLRQAQVHPEIAAQLLAYLLFFSGTLLFNQLLEKGPALSCFHWPRGVQACARLQQLLEWARDAGCGEAAERSFRKLSCTLSLLATPSAQLVQMSWASLRAAFPALSPAQLHRVLTQYQLASAMGPMSAWEPDTPDAFEAEDVLDSYENPPPIVLPSDGFQVDLEGDWPEGPHQQLLCARRFLGALRRGAVTPEGPQADSSCLLTPPGTPLSPEPGPLDWQNPSGQVQSDSLEGDAVPADEPPEAAPSRSPSPEDGARLVQVELERGPAGLGMGLIDGMHTPLGAPGLYIQTLVPGSPAATDGRLALGDRILEADGRSLLGLGYLRAVALIRQGGKRMRFLVAKSDEETARQLRFRSAPA